MSEVVVYGVPGSPFMRSALIALEEKHAPYRIEPLAPGALKSEEYRRLHPFGRVPAIRHGEFHLYETQAILRYVDARFPNPPLQPGDAESIGRMNQAIGINDWYLFPQVARVIVFERIVGPVLFGQTPNEDAIAAALPDARLCLGELDRLLGRNAHLAGADFSLADIQLAPQIEYLAATPEGASIIAGTGLHAWLERVGARASMRATLPPAALRRAA
jgi:glutathione S-transferase